MMRCIPISMLLASIALVMPILAAEQSENERDEAAAIDAYVFLYPLITMDVTRLQMVNVPETQEGGMNAPMNQLFHFRAFPEAGF